MRHIFPMNSKYEHYYYYYCHHCHQTALRPLIKHLYFSPISLLGSLNCHSRKTFWWFRNSKGEETICWQLDYYDLNPKLWSTWMNIKNDQCFYYVRAKIGLLNVIYLLPPQWRWREQVGSKCCGNWDTMEGDLVFFLIYFNMNYNFFGKCCHNQIIGQW